MGLPLDVTPGNWPSTSDVLKAGNVERLPWTMAPAGISELQKLNYQFTGQNWRSFPSRKHPELGASRPERSTALSVPVWLVPWRLPCLKSGDAIVRKGSGRRYSDCRPGGARPGSLWTGGQPRSLDFSKLLGVYCRIFAAVSVWPDDSSSTRLCWVHLARGGHHHAGRVVVQFGGHLKPEGAGGTTRL